MQNLDGAEIASLRATAIGCGFPCPRIAGRDAGALRLIPPDGHVPAPHLFVDISAHGFGHLAQGAGAQRAARRLPELRITIRSGLPTAKLQARLAAEFTHLAESSDFGYVMHDAMRVDLAGDGPGLPHPACRLGRPGGP
jgi:hypothetical protein